nr:MAG TPA: tail tube protein [Caudoviricetes sp.]
MDSNKIILGTFGKVFINNKRLANIKSFELKASMDYEEIDVNGNLIKQYKYKSSSLTGTMEVHKVDSYNINLVKDAIKTGVMPDIKIVGELSDPNIDGDEAIEITNVYLDEATLLAFTNGEVRDESTAFRAGGYNYISTID